MTQGNRKPIILFGDGSVFGLCLRYYKSRTNITHLVLLPDEERWKNTVDGIGVYTWNWMRYANQTRIWDELRVEVWNQDS